MALRIPDGLAVSCSKTPERSAWLEQLPDVVRSLERLWVLTPNGLLDGEEASCSYVVAVLRENGTPAVLKIAMPHMEGANEIHGFALLGRGPDGAAPRGRR